MPGVISGQIEHSTSVTSVMSLPEEPIVSCHNLESSVDVSPMQDQGFPDDSNEQSDDDDESDEWVLIR